MPELAEVEYYRRQWNSGLKHKIQRVTLHSSSRIFRGCPASEISAKLPGTTLAASFSHGKQMLFRFRPKLWLGIHLGMTGSLRMEKAGFKPGPHDHLVLFQKKAALVFSDPRLFGRVRLDSGGEAPPWWKALPPDPLSEEFTLKRMAGFFSRFRRTPLKALLLRQDLFPGIGNWMADEILWRSRLSREKQPARSARPRPRQSTGKPVMSAETRCALSEKIGETCPIPGSSTTVGRKEASARKPASN